MARIRCKKCGTKFGGPAGQCPRCGTLVGALQQIQPRCGLPLITKKNLVLFGCAFLVLFAACLSYVCHKLVEKPPPIVERSSTTTDPMRPKTLDELFALSPDQLEKVDIAVINLLCAAGLRGSENLDVEECLRTLDAWALNIDWQTKRNFHRYTERPEEFNNSLAYYRMGMMGTVLVQDMKIQYNPELEREQNSGSIVSRSVQQWNTFFSDSRDVFLNGLLSGKHYGTCSSMPFLYVAIGRRLGYRVNIAARKHHLYTRYEEENGNHLNIEATENQGFATPSDDEYRKMESSMTDEEIQGCGWLRPLSNKEVLGICLQIRSTCLRSMKRYDDEVATLAQALRYVPNTPLMHRVVAKNQELARNLELEDHCDDLLNELEHIRFPAGGSNREYFRDRKRQLQLLLNQSTNIVEIKESISGLILELKQYWARISDSPVQVAEAYGQPKLPSNQQEFLALLRDVGQVRRVRLPQEGVPREYWERIPAGLMNRLRKLTRAEDMLVEMRVYAAEEMQLLNLEAKDANVSVLSFGQKLEVIIRSEDLPQLWRGRTIPPELQARLANLNTINDPWVRKSQINNEIDRFFIDQDQQKCMIENIKARRVDLGPQAIMGPPLQIEIISSNMVWTIGIEPPNPS